MSDYAHKQTDKLLAEMEKKIAREYRAAVKEAQEKLDDYLRRFEIKDEKWRLMVARKEKTAEEYAEWRKGQIIVGKRWEALRDQLAADMHNANVIARSVVLGYMPEAYALNINFATFQIEQQGRVNTGFTLYSRETVERLLRENPEILQPPGVRINRTFEAWDAYKRGEAVELTPKQQKAFDNLIAEGKDLRWQKGKIQSITLQSIIQGESIPNMSRRIARELGEINHASTIRYARTAMTGAQNAGRQDAYKRAELLGVEMRRKWIATLDNRTRHEHRLLDGQERGTEEPFDVDGYKIMYPGDPTAEPFLIWSCRCSTRAVVSGWDRKSGALRSDEAIGGQSYEEWREGHSQPERIIKQEETGEAMRRKTIRELYGGNPDSVSSIAERQAKAYATTQEANDAMQKSLAQMYENHRIENGLTSVSYAELGDSADLVISANYGKMSVESAQAFTNTIQSLAEQYDTPLSRVRTMSREEFFAHKDSFAYVRHDYSTDVAEMVINPTKCKDAEALAARIRELAENGYCVSVKSELADQYVATHEFAHTLFNTGDKLSNAKNWVNADYEKIRAVRSEIKPVYERYIAEVKELEEKAKALELQAILAKDISEMETLGNLANAADDALRAVKISDYSLSDADEFMAEAFTNQKIGAQSNPYCEEVLRIIDKYFRR